MAKSINTEYSQAQLRLPPSTAQEVHVILRYVNGNFKQQTRIERTGRVAIKLHSELELTKKEAAHLRRNQGWVNTTLCAWKEEVR